MFSTRNVAQRRLHAVARCAAPAPSASTIAWASVRVSGSISGASAPRNGRSPRPPAPPRERTAVRRPAPRSSATLGLLTVLQAPRTPLPPRPPRSRCRSCRRTRPSPAASASCARASFPRSARAKGFPGSRPPALRAPPGKSRRSPRLRTMSCRYTIPTSSSTSPRHTGNAVVGDLREPVQRRLARERRVEPFHVEPVDHDVPREERIEPQRAGDEIGLRLVEDAFRAAGAHEHQQLLLRHRLARLVGLRSMPKGRSTRPAAAWTSHTSGLEERGEQAQRTVREERDPIRVARSAAYLGISSPNTTTKNVTRMSETTAISGSAAFAQVDRFAVESFEPAADERLRIANPTPMPEHRDRDLHARDVGGKIRQHRQKPFRPPVPLLRARPSMRALRAETREYSAATKNAVPRMSRIERTISIR